MNSIEKLSQQLSNININKKSDFELVEEHTFLLFKIIFNIANEYCYFFFNFRNAFNINKIAIYLPHKESEHSIDFLYNYCNKFKKNSCEKITDKDHLISLCYKYSTCNPDIFSGYAFQQNICKDLKKNINLDTIKIISSIKTIIDAQLKIKKIEYIIFPFTIYLNSDTHIVLLLFYIKKDKTVVSFTLSHLSVLKDYKRKQLHLFIKQLVLNTTDFKYNYLGDIRYYNKLNHFLINIENSKYLDKKTLIYSTCVYILVNMITRHLTLEETVFKTLNYKYNEYSRILIVFTEIVKKFMITNCNKIINKENHTDITYFYKNEKELNLTKYNLIEFPSEIFKTSFLESLILSHNNIEVLPDEITNLSFLKTLNFSNNKVSLIPSNINNLLNIQNFIANNNNISNLINLNSLISLIYIDVSNNPIKKHSKLLNVNENNCLKVLKMNNCQLTETPKLINLTKLEMLELSNNELTNIDNLNNLLFLYNLDLSKNRLTNVDNITNLFSLRDLNLSYNKLKSLPSNLRTLKKLLYLNLESNKLVSVNMEFKQKFKQLKEYPIDVNLFISLIPIKSLVYLNLSDNPIYYIPNKLVELNNLNKLELKNIGLLGLTLEDGRQIGLEIYEKNKYLIHKKDIIYPTIETMYMY
jgi:Leucine-rich repeat (LRR) protein